jgi:hypothetical protein
MKKMKRKHIIPLIPLFVVFVLSLIPGYTAFAQGEKASLNVELTTWKYQDGTRACISKVTATGEKGEVPVAGLTFTIINSADEKENILGTAETAPDGKAVFTISETTKLLYSSEGKLRITAKSAENDKYLASEASLEVKDARLEMAFSEIDSIRKITYRGVIRNAKGQEEPLSNTDVYFFAPRMFSMLKIVDGWLGEDGKGESDFPQDLSGDSTGVVKIYARIEENADFGNLEAAAESGWAVHKHSANREGPQRELWTPIAPLWMIITLIVMLAGVWAHYIYAVIQLVLVNKAGKEKKKKQDQTIIT